VVRAGTKNSSFAQGSDDLLDYLQLKVNPKQVAALPSLRSRSQESGIRNQEMPTP
jgi:hypothetical protein